VDIHGVHDRIPPVNVEQLARAIAGDGISEADYKQVLKVAYESSPISAVIIAAINRLSLRGERMSEKGLLFERAGIHRSW
jgi:hypothetical protein